MSWSVTLNDLDEIEALPEGTLAKLSEDNAAYHTDANAAFDAARRAGLVSATLSGGRTPSPYGGPDTVVISVVGFSDRRESHAVPPPKFNDQMMNRILEGPWRTEDVETWWNEE